MHVEQKEKYNYVQCEASVDHIRISLLHAPARPAEGGRKTNTRADRR